MSLSQTWYTSRWECLLGNDGKMNETYWILGRPIWKQTHVLAVLSLPSLTTIYNNINYTWYDIYKSLHGYLSDFSSPPCTRMVSRNSPTLCVAQRQASVPSPSLEKPATSPAIPAERPFRWFNAFRMGDDAKENYNVTTTKLLLFSWWGSRLLLEWVTWLHCTGPYSSTQVPTAGSRPLGEVRPASGRASGCVPSPRSARRSLDLLTMICRWLSEPGILYLNILWLSM